MILKAEIPVNIIDTEEAGAVQIYQNDEEDICFNTSSSTKGFHVSADDLRLALELQETVVNIIKD
ncbi:MAG: hypothetical protein KAU20_06170 [Nanoarchaeota archaeon]|nr:hypothetical protein [Nanoarchaeota archaeon]